MLHKIKISSDLAVASGGFTVLGLTSVSWSAAEWVEMVLKIAVLVVTLAIGLRTLFRKEPPSGPAKVPSQADRATDPEP